MTNEQSSYYTRHVKLYTGIIVIIAAVWGGFKFSFVMGSKVATQEQAVKQVGEMAMRNEEATNKVGYDLQKEVSRSLAVDEATKDVLGGMQTELKVNSTILARIEKIVDK